MSCADLRARLPAYWLGELPEAEEQALEDHVFGCRECTAASGDMADLVDALQTRLPPTLTAAAIARLERGGARMRHTRVGAGERITAILDRDADFLVHHLQLGAAAGPEVDCEILDAADDAHLMTIPGAVYEPASGELNLVCLRHYIEMFPPEGKIRVVAVEPEGRRTLGEYVINHVLR